MDIRNFFGGGAKKVATEKGSQSKDISKRNKSPIKPVSKSKEENNNGAKRQNRPKKSNGKKGSRKIEDSDEEVEIIEDSDNENNSSSKHKSSKANANEVKHNSKDKSHKSDRRRSGENEGLSKKQSKEDKEEGKRKKAKKISSDDEFEEEEVQPKKKPKLSRKTKPGNIFDSDEDEDPVPKSVKKKISVSRKKKIVTYVSGSEEESPKADIKHAFQKMVPKTTTPKQNKKESPKGKTTPVNISDFFGSGQVQRKERTTTSTKRKMEESPEKEDIDKEFHDDSDFAKTLEELDVKHCAKKPRIEPEPKEKKGPGLAGKLAEKVKKKTLVEETPEKKTPVKKEIVKKKSPIKMEITKKSPVKTPPAKTPPAKSPGVKGKSPDEGKPKLERKGTGYKTYLMREPPKALGSKEIPEGGENCLEGLTFVITGILESLERDEAKNIVEKYGGKVTGNVSKKTDYLVVGRDPGESKIAKANQIGTKQIDEDALLDLVRTLPGKKSKYEIAAEKEGQTTAKLKKTSSYSSPKTSRIKVESPSLSASSQSSSKTASPQVQSDQSGECLLWVDKYKPNAMKSIIGQQGDKSNARKLLNWIKNWHKNISSGKKPVSNFNRFNDDGSGHKAALLSGPPGVGKTTTAQIICKEAGFSFVELNASDTRSKKSMQGIVADSLKNHTLVDFMSGKSKRSDGHNHCLVMDEVDGMAGNEDRGGMQELIQLIKNSKIPIICMCNDRNHQKIRSLANYCFDLRFQRPRVEQIKSAMMSIAFKEGIKIPPPALNEIITAANQDIRQVIHNMSMWSANEKILTHEQVKKDAAKAKKDLKMGPFDVCRKVFVGGEETSKMTVHDKSDLFFHDYSFGPLFVHENYIHVNPYSARGDAKKHLRSLSRAIDSICDGDLVDRKIRTSQQWSLLPTQAIYSSVIPGEIMRGGVGQAITFPSWLGKNSSTNKTDRILQELKSHMSLKISGDKRNLNLEYVPHLRHALTRPLIKQQQDGVGDVINLLDEYALLKEDFDNIIDISQWPGSKDPMSQVESKVKAAFTRTYNKEVHLIPYSTVQPAKKKGRGGGGGGYDLEMEGDEGATEEPASEEEDDPLADGMIKKKKPTKGKADSKAKDSKGKGKGKGKGKK